MDMGVKPERVALDHLKPAYLDLDRPVDLVLSPRRGHPPSQAPCPVQTSAPIPDLVPDTPPAPVPVKCSRTVSLLAVILLFCCFMVKRYAVTFVILCES